MPNPETPDPFLAGTVTIERLHDDTILPRRATVGSAGMDLHAYLRARTVRCSDGLTQSEATAVESSGGWSIEVASGQMVLVPLGFRTRMPVGIEAQIRPRSGQAFKNAITIPNAPGTVDSDYAEEWMVIIRNDSPAARVIVHGERIAQVVFASYALLAVEEGSVSRTTERVGGFGSTGHG